MGFTKAELEIFRNATVPDLVGPACRLLFVGINPGLWTAATQTHFCHPSNRFYPALSRAGLIEWTLDTKVGMSAEQRSDFTSRGMGVTNLVARATLRASELSKSELEEGGAALVDRIARVSPRVVAIAGVTAYRVAFGHPQASLGRQDIEVGASSVWVLPNPSGLNAHETIDSLADWFRRVADEAGFE